MEKTVYELVVEFVDKNYPDASPEAKEKMVKSRVNQLLRV